MPYLFFLSIKYNHYNVSAPLHLLQELNEGIKTPEGWLPFLVMGTARYGPDLETSHLTMLLFLLWVNSYP